MSKLLPHSRIYCAVDTPDLAQARALGQALRGSIGGLKLGLEFFGAQGRAGVEAMATLGLPIFLDLKLHDIPNTVASAVKALVPLGLRLMTIHAGGGSVMMKAAVEAAAEAAAKTGVERPRILGVTVLTSMDTGDLAEVGVHTQPRDQVLRLAALAEASGLDGVICSPHEITALRQARDPGFLLVVPGIRPAGAAVGDQKRVMTPREAVDLGADYLVIGRPITASPDPAGAARSIAQELDEQLDQELEV